MTSSGLNGNAQAADFGLRKPPFVIANMGWPELSHGFNIAVEQGLTAKLGLNGGIILYGRSLHPEDRAIRRAASRLARQPGNRCPQYSALANKSAI
jgi:hypothetical protein